MTEISRILKHIVKLQNLCKIYVIDRTFQTGVLENQLLLNNLSS